jgi:hypothetical protein
MDDTTLVVEAEETRLREGRLSVFAPKRSSVTLDGEAVGTCVGYQTFAIPKGRHSLRVEPRNRRLPTEELAGKEP